MIPCLIVITLAFTWLLYESNWLRIRLMYGAISQGKTIKLYRIRHNEQVGITNDESTITQPHYGSKKHLHLLNVGIAEPITGWDWILNHKHPIVEYRISIQAWGCKHSIHLCENADSRIMKDVCKIAFAKPRNGKKPVHKVKGHIFNANYKLLKCYPKT